MLVYFLGCSFLVVLKRLENDFGLDEAQRLIHNVLVAIRLTIWMAKQQKISSICFKDSKCSFIESVYKPTWQGTMITGDLADQTVAAALVTETN